MIDAKALLDKLPPSLVVVLAYGAAVFFVIAAVFAIRRIISGDAIQFAGLRIGNDARSEALRVAIADLDLDIRVKTNLVRALRRLLRDLVALLDAPEEQRAGSSAELLYETLVEFAAAISNGSHDYHRASLWVPTPDDRRLIMRTAFNFRDGAVAGAELSIDGSIAGWVYRRNQPYVSHDITVDREFELRPATSNDYRAVLAVPIGTGTDVLGVLAVDAQEPGYFTDDHTFFAITFAALLAAVIVSEKARSDDDRATRPR